MSLWCDLNFYFNCNIVGQLDNNYDFTLCTCGQYMCLQDHFDYKCLHLISNNLYEEFPLHPPRNPDCCEIILEFEHLRDKYAFNNFIGPFLG